MKRLTYSSMAKARLRANRKQYISLILGIFLSIYMVSSLVLGLYGMDLAREQQRIERIGTVDVVLFDTTNTDPSKYLNREITQQELDNLNLFDKTGLCFLSGKVTDQNVYLGRYDGLGAELINLKAIEGRLPEDVGEMAMERSVLDTLDIEAELGDVIRFDITPIDGSPEERAFILVGFLAERSQALTSNLRNASGAEQLPGIITSDQEPPLTTGRLSTHRLMTLRKGVRLGDASDAAKELLTQTGNSSSKFVLLDDDGASLNFLSSQNANRFYDLSQPTVLALLLGCSLLLSCGVGIYSAMDSLLEPRREEIGALRALGATRRQIRRMFGRENWVLALTVSPAALAMSLLTLWGLSKAAPDALVFGFQPLLLLPIAAFSMAVILLSGSLPLRRAAKQMPMSVIRDTVMLRRSKRLRYKKAFQPAKLMASRLFRFNPSRQLGAAVLVGLMLAASGLLTDSMRQVLSRVMSDYQPGFSIYSTNFVRSPMGFELVVDNSQPAMSQESVARLRALPNIRQVDVERSMPITLIMDEVPNYIIMNDVWQNYGIMDDESFALAMELYRINPASLEGARPMELERCQQLMAEYDVPGLPYHTSLTVLPDLSSLAEYVTAGSIDEEAVNQGKQVIFMAGDVYYEWNEEYNYPNFRSGTWSSSGELVLQNKSFAPGQELHLLQMYQQGGEITRNESHVTIGAIISGFPSHYSQTGTCVLTTEQGFRNLGLDVLGSTYVALQPKKAPTLAEEAMLEQQITAIARHTEGATVHNAIASMRSIYQQEQQTMLVLLSVAILFFAVSVGLIVSSITRYLSSQGRTIGMLRAVGSDEKMLVRAYGGQIKFCMLFGLILGIVLLLLVLYLNTTTTYDPFGMNLSVTLSRLQKTGWKCVAATVMAFICGLTCQTILRRRIRKIVQKSIIENIREL